jgi:hypothetical protein
VSCSSNYAFMVHWKPINCSCSIANLVNFQKTSGLKTPQFQKPCNFKNPEILKTLRRRRGTEPLAGAGRAVPDLLSASKLRNSPERQLPWR